MTKAGSEPRQGHGSRAKAPLLVCSALCAVVPSLALGVSTASAAATPGVTATSIQVGLPYLDLAALQSVGLNLNQGSYPDAFNALINNLNAHGGIDGRKVALSLASVNPTSTASSASACTQLTQDDHVFVAFGPLYPLCYQEAGVATINGTMGASTSPSLAPNFTLTPPPSAFDPLQISVYNKMGIFKGKKVGVISASTDKAEVPIVLNALKAHHVDVVQTAVDAAPQGDIAASNQQIQVIAQRFQESGVDVVVGVGTGASAWEQGVSGNQSTYIPRLVATNYSDFAGTVSAKGGNNPTYLKNAITATAFPSQQIFWNDPAVQKCVSIIKKAYPSTAIGDPIGAATNAPTTWVAAENTCQDFAMFTDMARAAGNHLTEQSLKQAAYSLRNVSIPGMGAPVSFGPGRPYASGPVYLVTYDPTKQQLVTANKATSSS